MTWFRLVRAHHVHHDALRVRPFRPWLKGPAQKRQNYSAGSTASTPFFFNMTTTNFAGFVVLALRPTVCTSLGPS